MSDNMSVTAGVPQGSILGPLLFLVYINDIVNDIDSIIRLFADDTSLYLTIDDPTTAANVIQSDINKINSWADRWLVKFNPSKSESLIMSRKANKPTHPPLHMSDEEISTVAHHKHLGIYLSNDWSCKYHIMSKIRLGLELIFFDV